LHRRVHRDRGVRVWPVGSRHHDGRAKRYVRQSAQLPHPHTATATHRAPVTGRPDARELDFQSGAADEHHRPATPDFTIAYYASARERLNVTLWDYGYPGRWGGWRGPEAVELTPYTEGTVIIDVLNAQTKELIWRGRGQAVTSADPADYQQHLRDAVQAIVRKFPAATRLAAH